MVRGLVEQQQVGRLNEELAQRHATALTAGENGHGLIRRRAAQRVHRLVELRVDIPGVGGVDLGLQLAHFLHESVEVRVGIRHLFGDLVETGELAEDVGGAQADILDDGLRLVKDGFLHEDSDRVAGGQASLAVAGLIQAGHDLQDRGLTGTVRADHTDLGAREEAHGDIVEDDLVTDGLASLDHLINKLRHVTPFGWFGARPRARVPFYGTEPARTSEPPNGTRGAVILISAPIVRISRLPRLTRVPSWLRIRSDFPETVPNF